MSLLFIDHVYIITCNLVCLQTTTCVSVFCAHWQDRELTRWVHEVFLQSLDYNLLPVYLDVLQVLRAKVYGSFYSLVTF